MKVAQPEKFYRTDGAVRLCERCRHHISLLNNIILSYEKLELQQLSVL